MKNMMNLKLNLAVKLKLNQVTHTDSVTHNHNNIDNSYSN